MHAVGYNEFDFFWKMKNTDPLMGAKFKSKKHLLNIFLFWAVFCAFGFKVFKKCLYDKNDKWKKSKKISKNAEFHADFESVEKVVKKCTQKKFQRIQNQREFCVFLCPFWIFKRKYFLLFLAFFVNFYCKCAQNGSKIEKTFFMNVS
jgi:hypothetical protein